MSKIRIISEQDIEKIMTLPKAMEAVEHAYLQKHTGNGNVWPMVFHEFEPGHADLDIKSGNLNEEGIFGLKVVSWFGENPGKNLPALYGTSVIFELSTGKPKAVLNAGAITDLRTGAAGALGAKYLARTNSRNLLMAGTGGLAPFLIAATLITMPQLEKVMLVSPRTPVNAECRLNSIKVKVDELLAAGGTKRHAEILASTDLEGCVRDSDIVITATPAYEPFIKAEWVRRGTHFSCIGSDMNGKQEIDSAIFAKAKVFGDDTEQCLAVGECEKPYHEGLMTKLEAEIGAVIIGENKGRTSDEDITIFDSTGIALQDLACASIIMREAQEKGLGTLATL